MLSFCEFCEIFESNYFLEHIRKAASNLSSSVFGKFLICEILDSHCQNAKFSPEFRINSFQINFTVSYNLRCVFRNLSNIYDGAILRT